MAKTESGSQKITAESAAIMLWDIEPDLLSACLCLRDNNHTAALPLEDIIPTEAPELFAWHLLLGYTRCREQGPIPAEILPETVPALLPWTPLKIEKPIISVIIPACGADARIEQCLESILNQSLESLEVIVITNNPANYHKYAQADQRISIYQAEKPAELVAAIKQGLGLAKGRFCSFVDGSDAILPEFLMHGAAILSAAIDMDVVCFTSNLVYEEGSLAATNRNNNRVYKSSQIIDAFCRDNANTLNIWSKIYKTDFLRGSDLNFSDYMFSEQYLLLQIYLRLKKFCSLAQIGYSHLVKQAADNPQRRVNGIFQLARDAAACLKGHSDAKNLQLLEKNCIYELRKCFSDHAGGLEVFTDESLDILAEAPVFLRNIMEDYARILAISKDMDDDDLDPADFASSFAQTEETQVLETTKPSASNPMLSLIIYDANVPSLDRCLASITSQNIEDMEIILLLPGEMSGSIWEVCQVPNNNRSRFLANADLNAAIRNAKGNYLSFIAGSDWLTPDCLGVALNVLRGEPQIDALKFNYVVWDDSGQHKLYSESIADRQTTSPAQALQLLTSGVLKIWAGFYSRRFLLDKNIYFGSLACRNDIFMLQFCSKAEKLLCLDLPPYCHCQTRQPAPSVKSTLELFNFLAQLIRENDGVYSKELITALLEHFWNDAHAANFFKCVYANSIQGKNFYDLGGIFPLLVKSTNILRAIMTDYAQTCKTACNGF